MLPQDFEDDDVPWMIRTPETWETYQAAIAWWPPMVDNYEDGAFLEEGEVFVE